MNRRRFLESASAAIVAVGALPWNTGGTAARGLAQIAGAAPKLAGTPYPLVALPTKQPMGQVYDIPPNYETPTPHLIGTKNYPMTDNEYYYVRYREAMPAQLDPVTFRLKISGDAVEHPAGFSLDDLRALPQVKLGAVGECSGLGRGLLKTYSLITEPIDGTRVPAGSTADLRGVAWDHGQGIEKVEISADEGKTWEEATLEPSVGMYVWRVFMHSVTIAKPGQNRILSRATSADGATQPMDVAPEIIQNGGRQNNAIDTFAAILIGS